MMEINEDIQIQTAIERNDLDALIRYLHSGTLTGARRRREVLNGWLSFLADFAEIDLHREAPMGESGYIQSHIQQSGRGYEPGGAGGGGTYTRTVGVRRGNSEHPLYVHRGTASIYGSMSSGAQELLSRGEDMGLNAMPMIGRGRIYPRGDRGAASVIQTSGLDGKFYRISSRNRVTGRNFMDHLQGRKPALTFQKRGEPRKFRAWVSGQKPNPFIYRTFRHTALYAKGQIRVVAQALFPNSRPSGPHGY